jgi:hypothetical protein
MVEISNHFVQLAQWWKNTEKPFDILRDSLVLTPFFAANHKYFRLAVDGTELALLTAKCRLVRFPNQSRHQGDEL